jgi:tetrahydromethanopterin S-methyltransferase subunit A
MGAITGKIKECEGKDPGAFDADPMVVEVSEEEGGAGGEGAGEEVPMTAELALIHARMKTIQMMVTSMGYRDRYAAGVYAGKIEGIMIGLIVSFVLLGFLLIG